MSLYNFEFGPIVYNWYRYEFTYEVFWFKFEKRYLVAKYHYDIRGIKVETFCFLWSLDDSKFMI